MALIKFHYMPESPPCRAVEMVADLLGIELDKQYVNLFEKDHLKDDFIKINPLHKVPFIVDGDMSLGESRAIMTYLVNQYGADSHQSLYPKDPKQRAQVDAFLYFDMGTLWQAGTTLLKPLLVGAKKLDEEHEKTYKEALQFLDEKLAQAGPNGFVAGEKVTLADISIAATLSFPIACGYDLRNYKHIVDFVERFKMLIPNYSKINDEPVENLRKFVASRQASEQ